MPLTLKSLATSHPVQLMRVLQTVQAVFRTKSVTNHCFGKAFFYDVQHREHACIIQVAHLRDKCRGYAGHVGSAAPMANDQLRNLFSGKRFQIPALEGFSIRSYTKHYPLQRTFS